MTDKIKVLFLSASPSDLARIRVDLEAREIEEKIRSADHRDAFEFIVRPATRPTDLQESLLRYKPAILHFSGHGSKSDGIALEDYAGKSKLVSKRRLATLLGILGDNLRVVVLNACYTRNQADSIRQIVDYTVAMGKEVSDDAAVLFSASFYRALGFGRTVREAFDLATNAIGLEGLSEEKTPRLLVREGVNTAQTFVSALTSPPTTRSDADNREKVASKTDGGLSQSGSIDFSGATMNITGNGVTFGPSVSNRWSAGRSEDCKD